MRCVLGPQITAGSDPLSMRVSHPVVLFTARGLSAARWRFLPMAGMGNCGTVAAAEK
jgi:hypothetical protein